MSQGEKKKFKLFDSQREGKGISKADVIKEPNLKKFWLIYRENFFNRLLSINILMIIGNFPVIFLIMALAGVGQAEYSAPSGNLFGILNGIRQMTGAETPASLAMLGVAGLHTAQSVRTVWTYVLFGLGSLTVFTWGFVSAGSTYILRNLATGKPIFLMSDFFDVIRNNWRQALPFGIIDALILILLPYNLYTLLRNNSGYLTSLFFWATIVVLIVYFIMRWYIYLQMVSFNMKIFKIIKNSLYFVLLGIKRNLVALLGILALAGLTLLFLLAFNGYLVVVALFIPALMLFSNSGFMATYAAWYKIDEIMVIHKSDDDAPKDSGTAGTESGANA